MIGDRTIKLISIGSTNEYIKENFESLPSESVVVSTIQTAGYGRKGNVWESGRGGLWFSVLFKPRKRPVNPWHYVRMYSLGVYDVISKYKIKAKIKWPNDILIDNKKICGIIGENIFEKNNIKGTIIGIGINLNNEISEELRETAVTLKELTGNDINVEKFLSELNHVVYNRYYVKYLKNKSVSVITKKWLNALNIKNDDEVEIKNVNGEYEYGKIVKITPEYLEIMDKNYNLKTVYAGEISVRNKIPRRY